MKIEEFYTMYKYKRKENKYKRLTNNTLYLCGIIHTLWNYYFFKGKRLYIEKFNIGKKTRELRGKVSRFICPTYYMKVEES